MQDALCYPSKYRIQSSNSPQNFKVTLQKFHINPAANNLQSVVQNWEHLIYTSVGKVKHYKCTWYCISWTFNKDGTLKMCNNASYTINLLDAATQKYHLINQLPIHFTFKYLGSKCTPSGNIKQNSAQLTNT